MPVLFAKHKKLERIFLVARSWEEFQEIVRNWEEVEARIGHAIRISLYVLTNWEVDLN